jgi:glycosyltransferase involved in cell wall biosynthesis
VQPGDAAGLADAIEKLIDDRLLAQRLGQIGYQRAQKLFSIEKNVRELYALFA